MSWDSVNPLEYGLNCNYVTKNCDEKHTYDSGRYFIGPINYLIIFPANYQSIEFSNRNYANTGPLKTRTMEGLALTLHVSF